MIFMLVSSYDIKKWLKEFCMENLKIKRKRTGQGFEPRILEQFDYRM